MAGPSTTVTRTNLLAGPGQLWWDLAESATMPLDSEIGQPLAGTWNEAGATNGGLNTQVQQTMFALEIDQSPDPVGHRLQSRQIQVATSLAEATLDNLAVALNHDPAGIQDLVGPPAARKFELEVGEDAMFPVELAIVVDGWAPGTGKMRRVATRRCNSVEQVASAYQKDGQYLIPVTFTALFVDNVTSPISWTDES
jgi:hypothetical protein